MLIYKIFLLRYIILSKVKNNYIIKLDDFLFF